MYQVVVEASISSVSSSPVCPYLWRRCLPVIPVALFPYAGLACDAQEYALIPTPQGCKTGGAMCLCAVVIFLICLSFTRVHRWWTRQSVDAVCTYGVAQRDSSALKNWMKRCGGLAARRFLL